MSELERTELKLVKKSIQAIKQSIKAIEIFDLEKSISIYNTALTGFVKIQEVQEKREDETSSIVQQLEQLEKKHTQIIELFENGLIEKLPEAMNNQILPRYERLAENYKQIIYLKENNIDPKEMYYQLYEAVGLLEDLNEEVIDKVQAYWDKYYKKKTWVVHHLAYYHQTGKIEPRIIPQEVLNLDILPVLNGLNFNGFYSDKNVYDFLMDADSCPEVVLKRVNGQYFDSQNETISRQQAFQIFQKMKEDLIVKESTSDDGKSVEKLIFRSHAFYFKDKKIDLRDVEDHWGINFIVQKVLKQHPMMAAPHEHSVNTFRMVTLRWNNKINYLMTYARFGADGEVKDNGGEGGIVVGVSPEGKFKDFGMGDDGKIYKTHPTTGFKFKDFTDVPNFDEYIEFVKKLHNRLLHHNYVSWDIAMGVDGKPIFIEMNFRGPIWKYQMATEQPIFGEFTESILIKAASEREKREKLLKEQERKQEEEAKKNEQ